jgi:hypothetical protein
MEVRYSVVEVRWNFSDQALWIGLRSLNFSEGRHYANRWLDWRTFITFDPNLRTNCTALVTKAGF